MTEYKTSHDEARRALPSACCRVQTPPFRLARKPIAQGVRHTPTPPLHGKRILVTQADGFLGPALCTVLAEQGATVRRLSVQRRGQPLCRPGVPGLRRLSRV